MARMSSRSHIEVIDLHRLPRFCELFFDVRTIVAGRRSRDATRIPSKHVYCVYQRELAALTVHVAWHSSTGVHSRVPIRYATWLHFRSLCSSTKDVESPFNSRQPEDYRIARIKAKKRLFASKTSVRRFEQFRCQWKVLGILSPCFSRFNRLNSNVPLLISTKNAENFPLRCTIFNCSNLLQQLNTPFLILSPDFT